MSSVLQQFDISVFQYVNGFAGSWMLDRIVAYEEANALFKGGLFLFCYWIFWFRPEPGRVERRSAITAAITGTILALVVNRAISAIVPFSQRPMFHADIYRPPSVDIYNFEEWSSFPSDTATYFFALAFGLYRVAPRLSMILMGYAGVYICLPRIYLGIHWPSDIIVGALLGVAVVALVQNRKIREWLGSTALAIESRYPSVFYPMMFIVSFEMAAVFDHLRDALRGIARALKHHGLSSAGENTFLFTVLIAAVIVLAVGAMLIARTRRTAFTTTTTAIAATRRGGE